MCSRRSLKIKTIHNWVQIISPCSHGLAMCHVTRQRYKVDPEPKLSGTEKLLPSYRLRSRRSFFPDWQSWQVIIIIIIIIIVVIIISITAFHNFVFFYLPHTLHSIAIIIVLSISATVF